MSISRRRFLHVVVSGTVCGMFFTFFKVERTEALPRPPGALIEADFLAFCSRCNRCIDACQPLALHPAGLLDGMVNIGTPVLDVTRCVICMECIRKCPTGALKKIPKEEVDLGTAIIDRDRCLAWQKKKRCKACSKKCPTQAITLKERRYPVLDAGKCNGCGICVRSCSMEPKAVIISYRGARRFERPDIRFARRLENRVGPYEFPPPDFKTWFVNRIETLIDRYGFVEKKL